MMRRWVIVAIALALAAFVAFIVILAWLYRAPFRELEGELAWLKANNIPITRDEILPSVSADQNAAPLYRKAFAAMRLSKAEDDFLHEQFSLKRNKPIDWQKVRSILWRNRTAIALARQAAFRPHLRMTRWTPDFISTPFPHFSKMRQLVRLLRYEAALKKHDGDVDGAVKNCMTVFRMAHHPCDDSPNGVGGLVSIALFTLGHKALQFTLADADASVALYQSTLDELKRLDFYSIVLRGWHGERVGVRELVTWIKTAPDEKIIAFIKASGSQQTSEAKLRAGLVVIRFPPNAAAGEAVFLRSFRQYEVWFKDWLKKEHAPTKAEAGEYGGAVRQQCMRLLPVFWSQWAAILTPVFAHFFIRAAQAEALRRISMTAIALRLYRHEHGHYPDTLNALAPRYLPSVPLDPFTGKPLQYQRTQKGFRIWSIGCDGKDDGGLVRMEEHKWEKGDIVWESQR